MSTARSPRYPVIGLREAIEKARAVYDADYQNRIPKELVAKHMGYGGLNGKSLGVISAVSKYGLLEGRADSMWVSDDALTILHNASGDPERVQAVRRAASEPELFVELDSAFPHKASDAAIRSFLITKRKFLPDAADRVVRSYRETKEVVEAESRGYESGVRDEEPAPMPHGQSGVDSRPQSSSTEQSYDDLRRVPKVLGGHFPNFPAGVELPTQEGYSIMAYGNRVRLSADVDLKGAKRLARLLQNHIQNLEEDESNDAAH